MADQVLTALQKAKERVVARKKLLKGMNDTEKRRELRKLREVMFSRREAGEAFHELSGRELAILEDNLARYKKEGNLHVLDKRNKMLLSAYVVIRYGHITGREEFTSEQFRFVSRQITDVILGNLVAIEKLDPRKTILLMPWRAGLAFGESAHQRGFKFFYHVGAKRDERTLETGIYFEEIPVLVDRKISADRKLSVVVADPMLATGNTIVNMIGRLKKLGISEKRIMVASIISAPEGVDHVLSLYPRVRIVVGSHDECLDRRGFIVPGLGDFGDRYFAEIKKGTIDRWKSLGILTKCSYDQLLRRIEMSS